MTDVPDYLLQRSRDRRSALGLGGDGGGGDSGGDAAAAAPVGGAVPATADVPAGKAPVPVADAAPPEPEPVPANVAAAMTRKRIPIWALPALVTLPLWAWVYALTLEPPAEESAGALAAGEAAYGSCASCHGATGGGGVGPAFSDGAVLETFPEFGEHTTWVRLGSDGWQAEVGDTYGANDTAVGASGNVMPGFGESMSPEDLLAVVLYERVEFGGLTEEELVAEGVLDETGALLVTLDETGTLVTLTGEPFASGATETAAAE